MDGGEGRRSRRDRRGRQLGVRITVLMLGIGIGIVLFAYAAFTAAASAPDDYASIGQVIFVFRHGDRTPTETYPKDPYLNYKWPDGWGALTKKGMLQLYNVGRWIRKEYGSIIGSKYERIRSSTQSSYADRCIMSAQALLAGLYPPSPDEMFVPGLPWVPVPVHSTPRNLDKTIVVKAPCPRLEAALREAYANETTRPGTLPGKYYHELSLLTGQNISTITDVEFLYNTLEIEEDHGLKLPEWTKEYYNREMREIAARSLALFTSNTLQKRLRGVFHLCLRHAFRTQVCIVEQYPRATRHAMQGLLYIGPLLKDILERMKAFDRGTDTRRAYLYSAHDVTLVNLLRTMGFTDEYFKPAYGATLVFQLHAAPNDAKDAEVKLMYLNSSEATTAYPMRVPHCDDPCLLGNLEKLWIDVIPDNWDDECRP